jgi:hypothetical protein
VKQGVVIAAVTGTLTSSGPADCTADGEVACVSTSAFTAAATGGLASKIVAGQSVAGVAGAYVPDFPEVANVRANDTVGGVTGTLADCALDGATGCVSSVGFPAANLSLLTPSVLKKSVTVAGITGDYPSAMYRLSGADGTTDLTSLSSSTAAGSYEFFDSAGTRFTGSITDAGSISIGTSPQTFNTSLYRQFTVPGDADLVMGNIVNGVNILGVTGNVVLPATGDVRNTVAFGSASASVGSYAADLPDVANVRSSDTVAGVSGTLADCTTDGGTNCVAVAGFPGANTANFNGWDIRKKRNSGGTVLTFAGLAGQSKTCRNLANRTIFDNGSAPATSATLDFFDTIDNYNNNLTGLPGEIPAWTMLIGGMTVTAGDDFKCGGIYATGDTATGNTGADAGLAHDVNGNWQDLTPGIIPAAVPTDSANTANGCNAADKHCVFRELISGPMVTEVSAASYNWQDAVNYCHNLGEAGGAVTSPIPVIGGATYTDWRLPTQKELMQLYIAGARGLNQTTNLTTYFGNVTTYFWTSTTVSDFTTYGHIVDLSRGHTNNETSSNDDKGTSNRVMCVR